MTDSLDTIAKFTGLSRNDLLETVAAVKENSAKLRACKRHRYEPKPTTWGMKVTCLDCGGTMALTDMGRYIEGYEAAGGDANDIWPGYRQNG